MGTLQKDSIVKNVLKTLCCYYGWSYGVYWSYDQPSSILLTLQDAYFDEQAAVLFGNLLLQVPPGGRIIGQAAYTNKHLWMSSEDHYREQNSSGSIWDMFLDDSEFRCQFSLGMKTIAVIPVEPQGVVQFGSSEKILERTEFVNQTKRMFQEIVNGGLAGIASASSNSQTCPQNRVFASLISSEDSCFAGGDCNSVGATSSALFDVLPDFGIADDFLTTADFDVSQWFPLLPDPSNVTVGGLTPKDDLLSQALGFVPINSDEKGRSETMSVVDVDLLGTTGGWGSILTPGMNESHLRFHSHDSEGVPISESTQHVDNNALVPKERLFSKLGIEELLEGFSGISNAASTSWFEGQVPCASKRRKTGNLLWEMSSLKPVGYDKGCEPKKEVMPRSEPGLGMVEGCGMSGLSIFLQAKKQVEPPKPSKKKAKQGTRPRPKDRQLILDRMAELRKLIPNGEKMSIDCLLDRTIKHMLFLESLKKQADRIREAEEAKVSREVGV